MSTLIVNNMASIDSQYAEPDGNTLALQMDAAFDRENLALIERAETILLGRDSFDGFSSFWPSIADAPVPADPEAPEARDLDDVNRAMSRHFNVISKVVVTDRGPIPVDNPWADTTTTIARDAVVDWIAAQKARSNGDIVVFGSHVLWNHLLTAGLVDELHIMISPHAIGGGVALFTGPARLELLEARTYADSANVQLRYRPIAP